MFKALSGRITVALLAAVSGLLVVACSPALTASAAEQQPVQLSLKPIGQAGSYFDLTMAPGQSEQLQVELGNHGSTPIEARTYAADAYSIVNGGFGVKDRNSIASGTTTWLSYPAEILQLPAGQASTRNFTVTVPQNAAPGQYITALALENNVPVKGSGAVALNQLVRQAIAVSIRVPGPLQPAFTFAKATHKLVANRSVVDVGITNTGNANLKPTGQLVVHDSHGKAISRAAVTMDSLYAQDTTNVEVTLAGTLQPGSYTADITLQDSATHTSQTAKKLAFTVAADAAQKSSGAQQGQLPQILQPGARISPSLIVASVLVLLALAALIVLLLRTRRVKRGKRQNQAW